MEAFSFCCLESKKEQDPADARGPHTQHCTPSWSNLCRKLLPENQRSALAQAHVQMQTQSKPDGYQGFVATESVENTVLPPHHACDSALFTLSWRAAPFDQAGETLAWLVVLTKSQCAVCRQGNFPR